MMAITPKKLVHWDTHEDIEFGSPAFSDGSSGSMASSSTLEYINGQLVAHGFVEAPGLSLENLSNTESERLSKCLLSMLSQRIEDMTRTEELTTKYRTMTYDNERLVNMHRNAKEQGANAERETNIHKSRLATTLRTLQASESAQKHLMAELQRTKASIQALRTTYQSEIKKKERDTERMAEKWTKIADAQAKLLSAPSGMRCANLAVTDGSEILGKGQGYLEIALEQAELARKQLGEENLYVKRLLLTCINEVVSIMHQGSSEQPAPMSLSNLFPVSPVNFASDKISGILSDLRKQRSSTSESQVEATSCSKVTNIVDEKEIEKLQGIISTLKAEIESLNKQATVNAFETQAVLDRFVEDQRIKNGDVGEMSVELISAPLRDEEKARLDKMRYELDQERKKFTEAAIRLGKEKADLEAERNKLLDEKRSWEVDKMLAELPPTPMPASPARTTKMSPQKHKPPRKSLRKSPTKPIAVGKSGRSAARISRRSLASPSKVIPSYETEVLPPLAAPMFPAIKPLQNATSLLTTSFVLPPPSPHASLPSEPAIIPSAIPFELQSSAAVPSMSPNGPALGLPSTPLPVKSLFPVAKPFAQRMIHAYSPAKPSPLSRILMLADSPDGSGPTPIATMNPIAEEKEVVDADNIGEQLFPPVNPIPQSSSSSSMLTPEELGIEPSNDTNSEEENKPRRPSNQRIVSGPVFTRRKVSNPDPNMKRQAPTKEQTKRKTEPSLGGNGTRAPILVATEKENKDAQKARKPTVVSTMPKPIDGNETTKTLPKNGKVTGTVNTSRATAVPKVPQIKSGPRRVLIDSAEAPPISKGWK